MTKHNDIRELDKLAFSIADAAKLIGVGKTNMYMRIKDGSIKAKNSATEHLYRAKNLSAFLNSCPHLKTRS